jgi:hypothetical protein
MEVKEFFSLEENLRYTMEKRQGFGRIGGLAMDL